MDKTTPFFSIVMPVYGVADYLEQTLQSVAAQTFEDFEVILVDDCSPDDSPKICDAWVKKDERMTVLHLPENGGLSNARNAGFPHVRGEYVFFMDSDDVIDANLLEQVKASLEVNRADVVVFGLFACGEKKEYPITGSWTCDNGKIKEITLNEDGTGTIRKSSEISVSCTYSVENDKLTITTIVLNQQTDAVYTYTVTDRKLTLTDDSGSYEYTRQQ